MDLMQIAKFCSISAARRVKWTEQKRFYKIRHGILIYDSLHSIEKAKEVRVYLCNVKGKVIRAKACIHANQNSTSLIWPIERNQV